jgi:hypothetical protein
MAQTIAVQRGTATVNTDGGAKVTLFTQSSGTATRVIVGGMTGNFPLNNSSTRYMVFINVNGSGNYIPVIVRAHGNSSIKYITTFPNSESAIGPSLSGKISDGTGQSAGVSIGSTLNNGWGNSMGVSTSGQVFQQGLTFNQMALNISPGNFWMANGDSLVLSAYQDAGDGYTTSINYHFITVTES